MRETSFDHEVGEEYESTGARDCCLELLARAHRWDGQDAEEYTAIMEECLERMTVSAQEEWLTLWEIPAVLAKAAGWSVNPGEAQGATGGWSRGTVTAEGAPMITREEDWNGNAPFGICPACGADALELVGGEEDETTLFFCSDPNCMTRYTEARVHNPARTDWLAPNPLHRRMAWILRNHLTPQDDESCA